MIFNFTTCALCLPAAPREDKVSAAQDYLLKYVKVGGLAGGGCGM